MRLLLHKLSDMARWALWLSVAFTWIGLLGHYGFAFDLLSHFRVQYFCIQLIGIIWLLKKGQRPKWAQTVLLVLAVCLNGTLVWLHASPMPYANRLSSQAHLKLLQMNVLVFNHNIKAVENALAAADADIVSLQEVDSVWSQRLKNSSILRNYPYQVSDVPVGNLLISRIPLQETKLVYFAEPGMGQYVNRKQSGFIVTNIRLKGQRISLLNLHPPIPLIPNYARNYQRHIDQLAAEKPRLASTVIVIGDLNTTPWSAYYRQYLERLNLKDAKAHHYMITWPTYLPLLGLPIDHVLVSQNVQTLGQKLGAFNGSDHFPVEIELQIQNPTLNETSTKDGV